MPHLFPLRHFSKFSVTIFTKLSFACWLFSFVSFLHLLNLLLHRLHFNSNSRADFRKCTLSKYNPLLRIIRSCNIYLCIYTVLSSCASFSILSSAVSFFLVNITSTCDCFIFFSIPWTIWHQRQSLLVPV